MTSFSFGITFDALATKLAERLAEQPQKGGVVEIEARGYRRIQIAHAAPGKPLVKRFEEIPAGLIVTARDYSELIPYCDVFRVMTNTYTPLAVEK